MSLDVADRAQLLGLTPEAVRACASVDEIGELRGRVRKAYYRKSLAAHPDHGGTAEGFQLLREAYEYAMTRLEELEFAPLVQRVSVTITQTRVNVEVSHFRSDWWNRTER